MSWDVALKDVECGSSNQVCLEHFTTDDYKVSMDGKKYSLRPGAVPSLFNICLIEVNDDFDENFQVTSNHNKADNFSCNNKGSMYSELVRQVDELKSKLKNERALLNSRIKYLTKTKENHRREAKSLKRQVTYFKEKADRLSKSLIDIREGRCLPAEFDVNILIKSICFSKKFELNYFC